MAEVFLTVVSTCLLSEFFRLIFILIWAACYFTLINCRIPIYHAIAKIINRVLHEIFELSVPIQIIYFPGPQSNQPLKDADRLAWWRCCHPPPPPPFVSSVGIGEPSPQEDRRRGVARCATGAWWTAFEKRTEVTMAGNDRKMNLGSLAVIGIAAITCEMLYPKSKFSGVKSNWTTFIR